MNNTVSKLIASIAIFAASASFAAAEGNKNDAVQLPAYSVEGIDTLPSLTKRSWCSCPRRRC